MSTKKTIILFILALLIIATLTLVALLYPPQQKNTAGVGGGYNIDDSCICTAQYDPVCGNDGNTYSNNCQAGCAGITKYTAGTCE